MLDVSVVVGKDGVDQFVDEQTVRVFALGLDQVQEVASHVQGRLHPCLRRVGIALLTMQEGVNPEADLLTFTLRHTQNGRDDLHREKRGEIGHYVEISSSNERVEVVGDDPFDERLQAPYRIAAERLADQLALSGVLGG